jgi:hypothetical protein
MRIPAVSDLRQLFNCATPAELANFRRVGEKTLANERAKGEGPPYIKAGRTILYPLDELREWMVANTVHPAPTPTLADAPRRPGRPSKAHA